MDLSTRNCALEKRCSNILLMNNYVFAAGYTETCSLHGRQVKGKCQCDSLYSGPVCEYKLVSLKAALILRRSNVQQKHQSIIQANSGVKLRQT
jgi:hypothetical protein